MIAATVIAAAVLAVAVASVLFTRAYAGVSLDASVEPPATAVSNAVSSIIAGVRARVRRATRPGAAAVAVLIAWLGTLIAVGWVTGLLIGLVSERGSLGAVGWFSARRVTWLTETLQAMTWLGDSTVVVPVALVVGLLWWWRQGDRWALMVLSVGYLGSGAIYNAVKFLVARARPGTDFAIGIGSGGSYPSGHTANATAIYLGLLLVVLATGRGRRWDGRLAALAGALIAVVAASRVYLGVHWLADVIGGALLAALWIAGVAVVLGARPRTGAVAHDVSDR